MECQIIKLFPTLAFVLFALSVSSCYYDNYDDNYAAGTVCDTAVVTFNQDIKVIIGQNCEGCHNGIGASGGLNLAGHENIQAPALDGILMDRISRPSSDPLSMPPGGQLGDCDQKKLTSWINQGAPNN